ncbi:hypothetical protein QYF36_006910 [Acer negundo]|nr:hypothetical protein QYF36_006910 [Acer negundo]
MGTSTIIGVSYKGGVVLGTSTGMYVSNGTASDKITKLTDNVYAAGDSQIVSDYVGYLLDQYTIQVGQPATVKVAANLVSTSKNVLQSGQLIIVGGWDKYEGVWKQGITKQEAQQLVVKALSLANTARVVRPFTINSEGVTTNFDPGQDLDAHTSLLDLLNAPLAPDQRN